MAQPIGSIFVQCGNDITDPTTYRRILAQYIDTTLAPTPPQDLASVLAVGNSTGGLSIDASGIGGTAIDATGSDILTQNLNVEKITPLGAPIVTNVTLDGGLTLQTGGNYAIDFEDGIQLKDNNNAFIFSDGTDLTLDPTGQTISEKNIYCKTSAQLDYESEIRISKAGSDFIYTDPGDNLHLAPSSGKELIIDNGCSISADDIVVGSSPAISVDSTLRFKPTNEFWVSPQGDDILGLGTSLSPYATIQRAITQAELIADYNNQNVIYVGAGSYNENLTISKGYIQILGSCPTSVQSNHYGIQGDININLTDPSDLFQKFVILGGLVIRGSVYDSSTTEHSLTIQDCRINTQSSTSRAVYVSDNSVNKRVRLLNCYIQEVNSTGFTDPLIEVEGGWLYCENCNLTNKSVSTILQMGSGSFLARLLLTSFEAVSNSLGLPAMVYFNQFSIPPLNTLQTITQCLFSAPNTSGARFTPAILINTGVATTSFAFYGLTFAIVGTSTGGNIVENIHALAVPIYYSDVFSLPTLANKFAPGKFSLLPLVAVS